MLMDNKAKQQNVPFLIGLPSAAGDALRRAASLTASRGGGNSWIIPRGVETVQGELWSLDPRAGQKTENYRATMRSSISSLSHSSLNGGSGPHHIALGFPKLHVPASG
jgi:hypothetical protein